MQRTHLAVSLVALLGLALAAFQVRGGLAGQGLVYFGGALLGGLAGFALYHASFGF